MDTYCAVCRSPEHSYESCPHGRPRDEWAVVLYGLRTQIRLLDTRFVSVLKETQVSNEAWERYMQRRSHLVSEADRIAAALLMTA